MEVTRVPATGGVSLAVYLWPGDKVPFLLVHGLASNALLWQGVAEELSAAGHPVTAVDQRGHGQSDKPDEGYDFATLSADLAAVTVALGWNRPVVAGQSWGGNVVLELGAREPGVPRGLVLVDGGWIDLSRFRTWEECETAMAPPPVEGIPAALVEATLRERHPDWPESGIRGAMACYGVRDNGAIEPWLSRSHHMTILRHLWEQRPATLYPLVEVPVLLLPCDDGSPGHRREEVAAAEIGLRRSRTAWQAADHDVHAQHPEKVARLLMECLSEGFFA
ncbi:MAG: alpha/beta hydrolase [Actinomycetota bacterium]|nr:alpha/beta hydrolase [Actinomycetota bacterium]